MGKAAPPLHSGSLGISGDSSSLPYREWGVTGRTLWLSDAAQAFQGLCLVWEETPRSDSWSSKKSDGIVTLFLMFSVLIQFFLEVQLRVVSSGRC